MTLDAKRAFWVYNNYVHSTADANVVVDVAAFAVAGVVVDDNLCCYVVMVQIKTDVFVFVNC